MEIFNNELTTYRALKLALDAMRTAVWAMADPMEGAETAALTQMLLIEEKIAELCDACANK